jgi:hypothetical protein
MFVHVTVAVAVSISVRAIAEVCALCGNANCSTVTGLAISSRIDHCTAVAARTLLYIRADEQCAYM